MQESIAMNMFNNVLRFFLFSAEEDRMLESFARRNNAA